MGKGTKEKGTRGKGGREAQGSIEPLSPTADPPAWRGGIQGFWGCKGLTAHLPPARTLPHTSPPPHPVCSPGGLNQTCPHLPPYSGFPGDRCQGCRTCPFSALPSDFGLGMPTKLCKHTGFTAVTLLESFPCLPLWQIPSPPPRPPLPSACRRGIGDSSVPLPAASLSRAGWRVPLFWLWSKSPQGLPETRIC